MKEMNPTETLLRSLQPRHPSTGLKRRVLTEPGPTRSMVWFWGALMPATACMLLTLLIFRSGGDLSYRSSAGLMASNMDFASYADGERDAQNHLAAITFDWTNHSGFNSSISFTSSTNSN